MDNSNEKLRNDIIKETGEIKTEEKKSRIIKFFSKPWVGIIGFAVTIISLLFGIFTYLDSIKTCDLTYTINPIKTEILKNEEVSNLKVVYNGNEIKSDITVVQVAIWNNGKLPIKKDNILEPIRIVISPKCPILEASVKHQSRNVIGLKLDSSHYNEGFLPLSWNIMENNDSILLQLIYAGSFKNEIKVEGIVEGQSKLSYISPNLSIKSPEQQTAENKTIAIILFIMLIISIAIGVYMTFYYFKNKIPSRNSKAKSSLRNLWISLIILAIIVVFYFIKFYPNQIPYKFL